MLGAGPAADALLVALRIPNLVRRVLGEGAVNGAFVPCMAGSRRATVRTPPGASPARRSPGSRSCSSRWSALPRPSLPLLVLGLASGFADDPDRLALATAYARWTTPLIAASSLSALASAILAAQGRLRIAALAPVLVNAVLVLVLLGLAARPRRRRASA